MEREVDPLQRALLLHLLAHRGQQVRFEADQWTTEFGIFRQFAEVNPGELKLALRGLEMARWIYRRVQYVIGYSEPKLVYSLTPSGHRKAVDLERSGNDALPSAPETPLERPADPSPYSDGSPSTSAPL